MKNKISFLGYLLFTLTILLPAGSWICSCFGCTFKIVSIEAFTIAITIASFILCILSSREQMPPQSDTLKMLFAILTPLSLINAVFFILKNEKMWVLLCIYIVIGCSVYLMIKHGRPRPLKIISLALSAILILPIGFLGFISLLFGDANTIIQSVESPNGAYHADVIDNDQGALGGATLVDVQKNEEINLLIFKISQKPQRVYYGKWGEFKNMDIYWKDDQCLIINSVEYKVE